MSSSKINYNKTRRRARSLNRKGFKSRKNIRSEEPRRNYTRLGKGAFGQIHRPPYPCADNKELYFEKYASHNYVSKFMEEYDAQKELHISNIIKELITDYNDYYCLPEMKCMAAVTNTNRTSVDLKDTLLILPYCGISLEDIVEGKSSVDFTDDLMLYILKEIRFVITGINMLHHNKIIHNDLHYGNLMLFTPTFNKNYNNPRLYQILIGDFGMAEYLGIDSPIKIQKGIREDLYGFINTSLIPLLISIYNSKVLYISSNKHYLNINSKIFDILTRSKRLLASINSSKNSRNIQGDITRLNDILDRYISMAEYINEYI